MKARLAVVGVLLALGAASLPAQQAADTTAVAKATGAAVAWLSLVDQGQYEASWDAAAPAFQAAVTRTEWAQAVAQARAPFEPFGARTLIKAQYADTLPTAPPGPYVVIQFRTKVSGDRTVVETVVPMRTRDGSWRASGYFVRPE